MSRKENFLRVLNRQAPIGEVPLWELHFHLWNKLCGGGFVSGGVFMKLSAPEQDRALKRDAEIIAQWGQELGFSAVSIPDGPWDCIYTLPHEARLQLIRNIKALEPDFAIAGACGGVIAMPSTSAEYMDFCCRLFEEPEEIDRLCAELYEDFLEKSAQMAEAGVDALYIAADVADNRTPFFNREQQLRWYFPYLGRCARRLRELGVASILHTDGNISTILPDIRDSGIRGLQAIDPIAGMDIRHVQEFMGGQVAVCGNLDCCNMLAGTPEQVYDEARRILLACKDRPGFIFGCSNAVVVESPLENYMALLEAWKTWGRL